MKIKTSELTGAALDWAIAKCDEVNAKYLQPDDFRACQRIGNFRYSTNWAQGGPIIEREFINTTNRYIPHAWVWEAALVDNDSKLHRGDGPTPLIAAMRCCVASKLGYEVEVPDEFF